MGQLMGSQINPVTPPPMVGTDTQNQFFQALFGSQLGKNGDGFGYLNGLPGYQGQLSPDPSQTILPQVSQNWQPWNAGTGYLANYLGNGGGQPNAQIQGQMGNVAQYGGIGGYPTSLMTGAAQYGGTGGAGNKAMSNLLQFGAPSAAGQGVKDMSQSGVSGSWGNQLLARANGSANSPAAQMLAPYMQHGAYSSGWAR